MVRRIFNLPRETATESSGITLAESHYPFGWPIALQGYLRAVEMSTANCEPLSLFLSHEFVIAQGRCEGVLLRETASVPNVGKVLLYPP
jgi:hypothetical protein